MSAEDYSESLQKYWKWIHNLSPDVQKIVLACWDETGRPTEEHYTAVIMLLKTCNTWDDFLPKYTEMMSGFDIEDFRVQSDAETYWQVYVAGIKRMVED